MSHFYGKVRGGRGEAHRCGHKNTGLRVEASSWNATIEVVVTHDKFTGKDHAVVMMIGSGGAPKVLYSGEFSVNPEPENVMVPVFSLAEIETAQEMVSGHGSEA